MENCDERKIELETIQAIFPELVKTGTYSVSLEVPVRLAKPVKVTFFASEQKDAPSTSLHDTLSFRQILPETGRRETHHIWNFPSLFVSIDLLDGYPTYQPPDIKLKVEKPWLPVTKIEELEAKAWFLWEEMGHSQIIYCFIERLQEFAEDCFGMARKGSMEIDMDLKTTLLDYDAKTKLENFGKETFECGVCLEPKKGIVCHRLVDCSHVFCIPCLRDFYASCILEGDVDNVRCLNPSCGKGDPTEKDNETRVQKSRKLRPSELLQLQIPNERIQRYVKLRRKRRLEANPNTVYCPRTWCQGPARVGDSRLTDDETFSESEDENDATLSESFRSSSYPNETEMGSKGEKNEGSRRPNLRPPSECLAVCTDCSFAFCLICKRSWHGELGFCSVRNKKMFGREEKASEDYLKRYTTPCPTCNVRAQKTMGCNHMICRQCKTHFCYLCSSWLDSSNPYRHFNTLGTPCFQKLWELEGGDGEGAPDKPQPPDLQIIFEDAQDGQEEGFGLPNETGMRPAEVGALVPAPALQLPREAERVRARRRVQGGLARPAAIAMDPPENALRGHGLQRFLELAARDEEDGWDSDELEDQFVQFVVMDQ